MSTFPLFEHFARTTAPRLPRHATAADTPFVAADGAFQFGLLTAPHAAQLTSAIVPVLEAAVVQRDTTEECRRALQYLRAVRPSARPSAHSRLLHAAALARLAAHLLQNCPQAQPDRDELGVAATNALAMALVLDPRPSHARALARVLEAAGNTPLEGIAVYVPALTWLGQHLDPRAPGRNEIRCWAAASEAGLALDTGARIDELLDGLALAAAATRLVAGAVTQFPQPEVVCWIDRAAEWGLQATSLLPQHATLRERARELASTLDTLSASLDGAPKWFFGFPLRGTLPRIRLLDYLRPPKVQESRVFAGGEFSPLVLAACALDPVAAWISGQPALTDSIASAGGDSADFYALGEYWYDRIDAMRDDPADTLDASYSTGDAFLHALTCRLFATVRQQHIDSAADLQCLLRRCATEVEQPPGVDADDVAWVALALRPAIDAAMGQGSGERPLITWLNTIVETQEPTEKTAARTRVRAALCAARGILQLLRRRHQTLYEVAGPVWRHRARREMLALLEDIAHIALLIAKVLNLPDEDRTLARHARTLAKFLCSHRGTRAVPAGTARASTAPGRPQAAPGHRNALAVAAPTPAAMRVIAADAIEAASLRKQIQENWSLNKAERLAGELRRCAGNLDAVASLCAEFPWMSAVITRITQRITAAQQLGGTAFRIPPLLLVGHHGCGKTRFAQRLAEVQGLPWRLLAAGGSTDNRALAGTARGWSSAYPSLPVDFMGETGVANGLVVIDEIDKESESRHNGRLTDTLLQLLEPANARHFDDIFLGMPVDCSALNWILTANSLAAIQPAILSRVELMYVPQPGPENFPAIAAAVRDEFARRHAVDPRVLPSFTIEELECIQRHCRSARDVRRVAEEIVNHRLANEHCHAMPN